MKEQLIGWWVLSAGYSWLVRTTFEVDALSAWNWGPILVFLLIMMCGTEEEPATKAVKS